MVRAVELHVLWCHGVWLARGKMLLLLRYFSKTAIVSVPSLFVVRSICIMMLLRSVAQFNIFSRLIFSVYLQHSCIFAQPIRRYSTCIQFMLWKKRVNLNEIIRLLSFKAVHSFYVVQFILITFLYSMLGRWCHCYCLCLIQATNTYNCEMGESVKTGKKINPRSNGKSTVDALTMFNLDAIIIESCPCNEFWLISTWLN